MLVAARIAAIIVGLTVVLALPGLPDFWQPRWAVLAIALVGIAIGLAAVDRLTVDWLDAAVVGFLLYALASLWWTPDRASALAAFAKMAAIAGLFLTARRLGEHLLDRLPLIVLMGAVTSIALSIYEPEWNGGFGNENFHAEYLLAALPLLWIGGEGRKAGLHYAYRAAAILIIGWLATENHSRIGVVVLFGALLGYGVLSHRRDLRWFLIVFCTVGAGAILGFSPGINWSTQTRIELVINSVAMWLAAPFAGHGLASYTFVYPEFADVDRWLLGRSDTGFPESKTYVGHAHNEVLQLLVEFGLVGLAFAAAWIALAWRSLRAAIEGEGIRRAAVISAGFLLLISLVAFPLQTPVTAALAAVCLGGVIGVAPGRSVAVGIVPRLAAAALVGFLGAGSLMLSARTIHGHAYLAHAATLRSTSPYDEWLHVVTAWDHAKHDPLVRLQVYQTWFVLANTRMGEVDQRLGEWAWKISTSVAPQQTRLLLLRLSHLGQTGRCADSCTQIMDWLAAHASRVIEVRQLEKLRKGT